MCIHLLSTVNTAYTVPFRVTVHSLIENLSPGARVRWHVCRTGLTERDVEVIERHSEGTPVEFRWHDLGEADLEGLPLRGRAVAKMYERLLMPEILSDEVERFIYLDGDLLVLDDIAKLWRLELDGMILAAIQDLAVPVVSSPMGLRRYRELGFSRRAPYFNAGVYVADVGRWKRQGITAAALAYLERHKSAINLMDQDALNAVVKNRWKRLDYRWNLTASLAGRSHYRPRDVDPDRLAWAVADPAIIHFSGYLKPWDVPRLGSKWASAYERSLREVLPDHRRGHTARARALSFYDRSLRTYLYPVERSLWQRMRGF